MKKTIATLLLISALIMGALLYSINGIRASPEIEIEDEEDEEKMRETEHFYDGEEDEEEEMEIKSEEDDEKNLNITSKDNTIKFERNDPKIHFKYVANGTKVEFEAEDFALIEFVDKNNDSKVQDGEVKQKLKFNEIAWIFNYTKIAEGNNTIITVTYYANSTTYEITLRMKIYQRRVTEVFTVQNTSFSYNVDGGADEVKFDLIIDRWTWMNEQNKLALFMEVESEIKGKVELESASINEERITIKLDHVKIKVGWIKKAKILTTNGTEELIDVSVAYKSIEFEFGKSESELELDIYFIYPYFGEKKLVHDPSIGIEDDLLLNVFNLITPEVLLGTAITATAVLAIGTVLARRRKKQTSTRNHNSVINSHIRVSI